MEELIRQPEIVTLNVDELEENKFNPRIIKPRAYQALAASLKEFGNLSVLVFNKRTNRIVGGNQRLKILKAHGIKKTPAIVVDVDEDVEKALVVELNNPEAQGTWDIPRALQMLEDVRDKSPSSFDQLNLVDLKKTIKGMLPDLEKKQESLIPEMEILPYEHWDYIVLVFKDSRDWLQALAFFGIKKTKVTIPNAGAKVGLGRVLDGARVLETLGATKK